MKRRSRAADVEGVNQVTGPAIGPSQLLFGGDWACAHGDAAGLADIAQQLALRVRGPLEQRLLVLSDLCHTDYDAATQRWPILRVDVRLWLARPGEGRRDVNRMPTRVSKT
jgi:hypothetical protein